MKSAFLLRVFTTKCMCIYVYLFVGEVLVNRLISLVRGHFFQEMDYVIILMT